MPPDDQTVVLSLVFVNIVVYAIFFVGLKKNWKHPILQSTTIREAFQVLERSVRKAFPDLPQGFTWGEAISKAKSLELKKMDWLEFERELRKYEAHRYGGEEVSRFSVREILKLAALLPKGGRFGTRSKIKSSQ